MAERLVRLSTPGRLYPDHRDGFERARLALYLAGISTGTTDATHAVRTVAEQEEIFFARYTVQWTGKGPYGDVRWYKGVRYVRTSPLGSAAIPGTSNHGRGDTVDWQGLGKYETATWKRADPILRDHGWSNREGREVGEPWHWTRVAGDDNHRDEEAMTVTEYQNIMKRLDTIDADNAWIKKRLGGNTSQDSLARTINDLTKTVESSASYKDSSLATEVAVAAGVKASALSNVNPKYVPTYMQSVTFGMRAVLATLGEAVAILKRIAAKIGA